MNSAANDTKCLDERPTQASDINVAERERLTLGQNSNSGNLQPGSTQSSITASKCRRRNEKNLECTLVNVVHNNRCLRLPPGNQITRGRSLATASTSPAASKLLQGMVTQSFECCSGLCGNCLHWRNSCASSCNREQQQGLQYNGPDITVA